MYYPVTGWMLFDEQLSLGGTQDLLQPPPIHQSGNGWIYKPDEARTPQEIKRGTNKAWPRKDRYQAGREYHAEWHAEYMRSELASRGWKLPTKIERPQLSPRHIRSSSMSVHWNSQPWGWQSVSLTIHDPRRSGYGYRSKKNITLSFGIDTHPAARWYKDNRVENVYNGSGNFTTAVELTDRDDVRQMVRKWRQDPWGQTIRQIPDAQGLEAVMQPPEMESVEYFDEYQDDMTLYGVNEGSAEFWTKGKIEEVMKSDVAWKALQKVIKAFEFTGYGVRVTTEYSYRESDDVPITGIEIDIPDDPDSTQRSRKSGHKITIDRNGIDVSCGFVNDEKAWMEREKRMAKDHMALLEEDLFTEFSIDLNE